MLPYFCQNKNQYRVSRKKDTREKEDQKNKSNKYSFLFLTAPQKLN